MKDWVGVVYKAPHGVAKATLTVTVDDGKNVSTVEADIVVTPEAFVQFIFSEDAFPHDRFPGSCYSEQSMDINTTARLRASVFPKYENDLEAVIEAYKAGLYKWEINGDCVEIKGEEYGGLCEQNTSSSYSHAGFYSYLTIESGTTEGDLDISFSTLYHTCHYNLSVENFAEWHPVDRVIIRELSSDNNYGGIIEGKELDERTFVIGDPYIVRLEVLVYPDLSYVYYDIEVVSSDPSIIDVAPKEYGDGFNRIFIAKKPGQAVITATAGGKSKTMTAYVVDKVRRISFFDAPVKLMKGDEMEIAANVRMSSGSDEWIPQCEFTVSDPSIVSVENVAGKPDAVRLTALTPGKTTLTATADGVSSNSATIEVLDTADFTITNDDVESADFYLDSPYADFGISFNDGTCFVISGDYKHDSGNIYGDYSIDHPDMVDFKGADIDDGRLSVTVTADPDDEEYAYVNGTATLLPYGMIITFSNLRVLFKHY